MELFYCPFIEQNDFFLDPDESRHCVKVLRKKAGDVINVTDGNGNLYKCEVSEADSTKCSFHVESKEKTEIPTTSIHIAIAPTKNLDRTEFFVEKAVEIGVQKITFIQTKYSERKTLKVDRVRKKAIGAMKQSCRTYLPNLHDLIKLGSFITTVTARNRFVAHLDDQSAHLRTMAAGNEENLLLIGPEGGFSEDEITLLKTNHFQPVRLGNYRLRTETAGVVACSIFANLTS